MSTLPKKECVCVFFFCNHNSSIMNYIHLPILILIFILVFWLLIFSEFCLGPERINKIQKKICTFMAYRLLNFLPVNDEEIENLELQKKSTYVFYGEDDTYCKVNICILWRCI